MVETGNKLKLSNTLTCGRSQASRCHAFTVVEICIILLVLGIVATIVIPQFSSASTRSRENSLKDDLNYLRTQIRVYKAQHQDVPPGYPRGNPMAIPSDADFSSQLTMFTDLRCNTAAAAHGPYGYGPYLNAIPTNPMNGMNSVEIIGNNCAVPAADGSTGWIYKPQTQEIVPNIKGNDAAGDLYTTY